MRRHLALGAQSGRSCELDLDASGGAEHVGHRYATTPSNEASVHGGVPHLLAWTHRSTAKAELRRQVLGDHEGVAPSER